MRLALGLALVSVLSVPVSAQQSDGDRPNVQPPRMRGFSGVQSKPGVKSAAPGRMSGLGGVRSQPGVKSEAPRGVNSTPLRVYTPSINKPGLRNPGSVGPSPRRPSPVAPTTPRPGFGQPLPAQPNVVNDAPIAPGRHWSASLTDHGYYPLTGGGLTIAGSYHDDSWKLVFRIGGVGIHGHDRHHPPHKKDCIIVPVYTGACYGFPYWGFGSYYDGFGVAYGYTSAESYSRPVIGEPAPQPSAAEQEPMTAEQHAEALLRYGDSKGAIAAYKAILKVSPSDAESLRGLGLSLIDNGQPGDGIAIIAMAYRADATLAAAPLPETVYGKSSRFRSNLTRVSMYANRTKSASGWLALAVLMQAEGRHRQALAMIDRAKAAGLEGQIVQEMTTALSPSEIR